MRVETAVSSKEDLVPLLVNLFSGYDGPTFSFKLWDGWQWTLAEDPEPHCTLIIHSPHALASLAHGADEVALGEAFIHKELDVEGDILAAFPVVEYLIERPASARHRLVETLVSCALEVERWFELGIRHSPKRDQASIAYHYDLPVAFYRPWLGPTLAYSCAYFRSPEESLDQAQTQKLELISRKLRLKEQEHFLDIGCGWGSLVLHAAGRHRVQARGITLSREQAAVSNQRIMEADLGGRCRVEFRDYRECGELAQCFEKIASVGMYEHVGLENLPLYFKTVYALLKPGGTFLNHGIARSQASLPRTNSFIDRYVFPDGKLVTVAQAIEAAERAGFEVRDLENLREHYELTLRKWVDGLKQHKKALLDIVSESTYRIWLLYTAGSAAAFRRGDIAIYQVLLSRPDRGCSRLPLLREDWYSRPDRKGGALM